MTTDVETNEGAKTPDWKELVAPFRGADTRRSILQLTTTLFCFAGLWAAMYYSLAIGYWLTLLLAVPAAAFLVRLFMIQHDCGHGSYFRSRRVRDWTGFVLGVLTMTPYQYWQRTHAYHHAHSGDLDFRGFGDIETRTVKEYQALSRWQRFAYRFYRHPAVLFGGGAAFQFLIKHRFPWDIPHSWKTAWRSVWLTNAAMVALVAGVGMAVGFREFLMVQLPISLAASSIGVWLFYVQHQFEDTYWHRHRDWDFYEAAILGSSHLALPRPLQWLTASIGLHQVHHLSSLIPNYRLEECLEANPDFQRATRIRMVETLQLIRLTLWDEESERLVSFREAARRLTAVAQ